MPLLILGTHNRKKGIELLDLLRPLGIDVRTLADFADAIEVVEDGETFAANAAKKASEQARHLRQWVLAEDSGLCVDALRGAPGVYSARYSGTGATDETNNRRLIAELANVPLERRSAHYVCHAALADPQGTIRVTAEERCRGRIIDTPRGDAGFGYDPYFEIPEYHRTFAELGLAVKGALSHRARALRRIVPEIVRMMRPPS